MEPLPREREEEGGGEVEAWGKSKLPAENEKLAGGGDGEAGGRGIGDVVGGSHWLLGWSVGGL